MTKRKRREEEERKMKRHTGERKKKGKIRGRMTEEGREGGGWRGDEEARQTGKEKGELIKASPKHV